MKATIEQQDADELKALCQRPNQLAFFDIDFGNDPYGVFSAVMTEGLHAIEKGLIEHMLKELFEHKLNTTAKKGNWIYLLDSCASCLVRMVYKGSLACVGKMVSLP